MPSRFNVGDRVRCVREADNGPLFGEVGEVYEVTDIIIHTDIKVRGLEGIGWLNGLRFELTERIPMIEVTTYQIYFKYTQDGDIQVLTKMSEESSSNVKAALIRLYPSVIILGTKKIKVRFPQQ